MTKIFVLHNLIPKTAAAVTAGIVIAVLVAAGCSDSTTETQPDTPPTSTTSPTEEVTTQPEPDPEPDPESGIATGVTTSTTVPTVTTTPPTSTTTSSSTTSSTSTTTSTTVVVPTVTTTPPPTTIPPPPTTTPPTTTAKPAPKTDADFRAIAAAGDIPYDPDSPNGIHVSYFWPDGFPDAEPFYPADSELPEDYHLYEYTDGIGGRHKVPEGLNFTCDSPSGWGRTIREEWHQILTGSHYKYKEPYHDCEWALGWWVLGFRQELADYRGGEFGEFWVELGLHEIHNTEESRAKRNAEHEIMSLIHSAGIGAALGAQRWE